jgi:site-specific recombinase XerD
MGYKTNIRVVLKNINKEKIGTLFLEVSFIEENSKQKVRRYKSTNQKLHADDIARGRIKQIDRTKSIRLIIAKQKYELNEELRKLIVFHKEISPSIYDESITKSDYERYSVDKLFQHFIEQKTGVKEERTIQKYKTFIDLIEEFKIKRIKKKSIYSSDLSKPFYQEFTKFLTEEKNHAISTVNKYQSVFTTFLQFLQDDLGIKLPTHYKEFKKSTRGRIVGAKVVLLKEHVQRLIDWDATSNRYGLVRDLFIFQILTGIRFSDLERVNKSFVINNSLSFVMYKTTDRVNIPLHPLALKILKKYDYDLATQCKSIQKYNDDLKVVAELAGLTDTISQLKIKLNKKVSEDTALHELLSSHVGRSTFITNCLVAGISPFIVMAYTGHKDIDTMSVYMKLAGDMERDAFSKFEEYFKF